MNPRHLRYFLAVVDHGGVQKAAAKLHISQPSLSQVLRQLEQDLSITLFERRGRGVVLTEAGRVFLAPARRAIHGLDAARESLDALRGLTTGTLRLIALPSLCLLPMPDLIAKFHQLHSGIQLSCIVAYDAAQLAAAIQSATADVALGVDLPESPGMVRSEVGGQDLWLALPPHVRPPSSMMTTNEFLQGMPVIAGMSGTKTRALLDAAIAARTGATIAAEISDRNMVVPLIQRGVGCGFVAPAYAHVARSAGLEVIALNPRVTSTVHILHRSGSISPAAQAFVELVRNSNIDVEHGTVSWPVETTDRD